MDITTARSVAAATRDAIGVLPPALMLTAVREKLPVDSWPQGVNSGAQGVNSSAATRDAIGVLPPTSMLTAVWEKLSVDSWPQGVNSVRVEVDACEPPSHRG
jgi:ATP-dependent phosphoenolpyruvate carboxykinase